MSNKKYHFLRFFVIELTIYLNDINKIKASL
jgi:hypothetical protein